MKTFLTLICLSIPYISSAEELKTQRTLSIIKPDGVAGHHIGEIIAHFEKNDLHVAAIKMLKLSKKRAGAFYAVHKGKPFYAHLTEYMSSGPVVVMVLEGKNAIAKNRELMGATDPQIAVKGSLRQRFAKSKSINTVHGSDAPETAKTEIAFFFTKEEVF